MQNIDAVTLMLVLENAHHLCVLKEKVAEGMWENVKANYKPRASFYKKCDKYRMTISMHDDGYSELDNFLTTEGDGWNEALQAAAKTISVHTGLHNKVLAGDAIIKDGKFYELKEITE